MVQHNIMTQIINCMFVEVISKLQLVHNNKSSGMSIEIIIYYSIVVT